MKRLELLIAYSIACASATLASLYGFMSASGYYGLAKGLGVESANSRPRRADLEVKALARKHASA